MTTVLGRASVARNRAMGRRAAVVAGWAVGAGLLTALFATDNVNRLLAALGAALLFTACWGRPKIALVVWMLAITMMPIWISVHFFATLPMHCIVAVIAVAATIGRSRMTITRYDVYFALILGIALVAVLFGSSTGPLWAQLVVRWGIPFFATRVLLSGTGIRFGTSLMAILFGVVGGLATIEFLLSWHPFVGLYVNNVEFNNWHGIQTRGGRDRSEWAFGHSIALGGALALSIPFVAQSTFRPPTKTLLFVAVFVGIVVTASRGAFVAAGLTSALCLLLSFRRQITRAFIIAVAAISAYLLASASNEWWNIWARGASGEEQVSFNYRNSLYSSYLSDVKLFGKSFIQVQGSEVHSIDSAILRLGLEFGWVFLIVLMMPLALSMARVLIGNASFAELALVGQTPLFASVALITQYESLVFVVVGFAVQALIATDRRNASPDAFNGDRRDTTIPYSPNRLGRLADAPSASSA
jgi:hypothetical protein